METPALDHRLSGPTGFWLQRQSASPWTLVTNWTRNDRLHAWLVYDGNVNTVKESHTLRNRQTTPCPHFSAADVGDPMFTEL